MKTQHVKLHGRLLLPCTKIIILLMLLSCTKNTGDRFTAPADDHNLIGLIGGEKISGSLSSVGDEEGLVLLLNDYREIVVLQKIPGGSTISPVDMTHAEVICSDHGVIVRDVDYNKIWMYPNNDPVSIEKFETIKADMPAPTESSVVYGFTRIRSFNE